MANKKWTINDDKFLFEHWENIGPMIAKHDLGRSEKACQARVDLLKETGAWDALSRLYMTEYLNLFDYYKAVGTEEDLEFLDLHHGSTQLPEGFWDGAVMEERSKSHMLQDYKDQGLVPSGLTIEQINRRYPSFWETGKLESKFKVIE